MHDRQTKRTARMTTWKHKMEGVDHLVRGIHGSGKKTMEGVDHPYWKQMRYDNRETCDDDDRKIDGGHPGRWVEVGSIKTDDGSS